MNSNKTKYLNVKNDFKKLQKFDSSYFRGKNYFAGDNGIQNYLVFQPVRKYFRASGTISTENVDLVVIIRISS